MGIRERVTSKKWVRGRMVSGHRGLKDSVLQDEETPGCLGGVMATGEAGAEVRGVVSSLHRAGP